MPSFLFIFLFLDLFILFSVYKFSKNLQKHGWEIKKSTLKKQKMSEKQWNASLYLGAVLAFRVC